MGVQSEANAVISHPKPSKMDHDVQKAPTYRQLSVSRTVLDTKTSKFVSARLGPDGVQCGHKGLYWFGQRCPYVQWILLLLVLPCTGVLVVGVISFRKRERIPSLFGGVWV
jgi:hypothetical protein